MTVTINIPDYLSADLASIPDEELEGVAVDAFKAKYTTAQNGPAARKPFPSPGALIANRLAREAKGDFRTVAEIIRQDRDYSDNRIMARAWRNETEIDEPAENPLLAAEVEAAK